MGQNFFVAFSESIILMENIQNKNFMKLIYLISRVFLAWTSFKFTGPLCNTWAQHWQSTSCKFQSFYVYKETIFKKLLFDLTPTFRNTNRLNLWRKYQRFGKFDNGNIIVCYTVLIFFMNSNFLD